MNDKTPRSPSRQSRFAAGVPALLRYRGAEYACEAHNLSRNGVLLKGAFPRPIDNAVEFSLSTPHGDISLDMRGRVVRVTDEENGQVICLGLQFLDVGDRDRERLETLISRLLEGQAPAPLEKLRPGAPTHEVRKALESIPLPHRIALAARANPKERAFLREDQHPKVLESLARNPNLLQAEARALAASIHLIPSTLELLANDMRWQQDQELRIIIATHARTPLVLAERLLAKMPAPALRQVLQRPGLNPTLRTQLTRRLARGR
jgi:hypothetical protein